MNFPRPAPSTPCSVIRKIAAPGRRSRHCSVIRPRKKNCRSLFFGPNRGTAGRSFGSASRVKSGLYGDDDQLVAEARKLLATGTAIVAPDLLYQGEFLAPGQTLLEARRVKNPREFAGFTLGYNRALCAQRAHDVLSIVSWLRYGEPLRSDVVGAAVLQRNGTLGRRGLGPIAEAPWTARRSTPPDSDSRI